MTVLDFKPVDLADFDQVLGSTSTEVSSVALGGRILACSDEWFAPASDLLKVRESHRPPRGSAVYRDDG